MNFSYSYARLLVACLVLLFAVASCEKDSIIQTSETPPSEIQSTKMEPVPDNVTLKDITVTVTDGMLFFAKAQDYRIARKAVSQASDEEYLAWQTTLGFKSQYARYIELLEYIESSDARFMETDLEASDKIAFSVDKEQGLMLNYPSFAMSKLLNMQGRVIIEGDLNQYTADHHILIDGIDAAKLESAAITKETNFNEGIIVQPVIMSEISNPDNQKVQFTNLNCLFGPTTTGTSNGLSAVSKTDEQTVDGNRQQLRTTYYLASEIVVINQSSGQCIVDYTMAINFDNRRRSGLNWNQTYPNMAASYRQDRNPGNSSFITDELRVNRRQQVFVTGGQFGSYIGSESIVQVSAHPSLISSSGIQFFGQGSGTIFFDEVAFTTNFTGQATSVSTLYQVDRGTASVRWTNRGDNVVNDPISSEFYCQ